MISIVQVVSDFVINFIHTYGYASIFFLMLLESANIPIPSEITMPFSGYLVYQGNFSLIGITIAGTLGNLVGSILSYYLGAILGRPLIIKYGKYFLIPRKKFEHSEVWFKKYGHDAIFFGRLLPIVRTFISLPAGIEEMKFKKFLVYTTIGCAIWTFILGYVGILLGPNWESILGFFQKIELIVVAGAIILFIWYVKSLRE